LTKRITEFICRGPQQVRVNKRAFLIPLIADEDGHIPPYPIHTSLITHYHSKEHFETTDSIYLHYRGEESPFIDFKPTWDYSTIIEGEPTPEDIEAKRKYMESTQRKFKGRAVWQTKKK